MTGIETQSRSRVSGESRRSTRVHLMVVVEAQGFGRHLTCEGKTVIVNFHGALISTAMALTMGMKIEIHVDVTGKHATAEVVYVDPENPLRCGIELATPQNIWGMSLPPKDWHEGDLR